MDNQFNNNLVFNDEEIDIPDKYSKNHTWKLVYKGINHIYYEYIKDASELHIDEVFEHNRSYNQLYIRRIPYAFH